MNDDLDEEIIGSDEGFDEFVQKNTLGDVWRNNPLVKVGIVIVAAATIFGVIVFFGSDAEEGPISMVAPGSSVSAPPGTEAASPAYVAAVEASNEADLERALQEGESTLPVPVETPSERLQLPQEEVAEEDPLHRWRKLQEERVVRDTREREEVEPVTVLNSEQQNEAMQRLVESMSRQMESVLSRRTEKKTFSYVSTISGDAFDGAGAGGAAGGAANGDDDLGEEIDEDDTGEMVIPAGEIEYAQLLIEANSDVPGPVMALLVSGPLKGSRVLGTFSVQNDKYLTVTFDSVIVDGESVDISAIALDPDTTLPGMATEVDNRYFQRVLLPAAAAFVEGFADALSESGSTTITIDTGGSASATETADKTDKQEVATGVEEAAEEVRDIIDDMADDIEVLVKIHAGTPMGILFTEPVVLDSSSGFDDEI